MCSAARDSSVTAGLVWACLRRACLRPARARALGEGSGDRASRPGPLLPAPPPSRPPSFHSPVRPFVCRDAEVAVCPLYCVAGGAGVLQASVLAGEGHGEGSECRFTVTGEPALGHPARLSARPPAVRSQALVGRLEHFGVLALSQALGSCPDPPLVCVCGALAQGRVQTRIHTSLPAPPLVSMWHFLPFLIVSGVIFPTPTGLRRHRFPAESGPVPGRRLGLLQLACWPC